MLVHDLRDQRVCATHPFAGLVPVYLLAGSSEEATLTPAGSQAPTGVFSTTAAITGLKLSLRRDLKVI